MESQVKILIRCPQCGADMGFPEETQVIHCEFCGSSLLVAGRHGVLRYALAPRMIQEAKRARSIAQEQLRRRGRPSPRPTETFMFYAPFWRVQGTAFRWVFGLKSLPVEPGSVALPPTERVKELFTRVLDHTTAACSTVALGLSNLGVRPQVLELRPLGGDLLAKQASLLPLDVPLERVQAESLRLSEAHLAGKDAWIPEVILHRLVGRRFSVIYLPIWYVELEYSGGREFLFMDAVDGRVIHTTADDSAIPTRLMAGEGGGPLRFGEIRFLPFRCPNCGWAFPFRPMSVLHLCPTCHRLWCEARGEWTEVGYDVATPPRGRPWTGLLWVPFWRYRTRLLSQGKSKETMADLYRLAPPLKAVSLEREARRPIQFYVPAMRLPNPKATHDLSSRITFMQPEVSSGPFPDAVHPMTAGGSLPETDAREMGALILGAIMPSGSRPARSWLKGCEVEMLEPRVRYFPFERKDLFWKELWTGVTFPHSERAADLLGAKG